MHLLLTDDGGEDFLSDELRCLFPDAKCVVESPRWISTDAPLDSASRPLLAFCRQALPDATRERAASINQWADLIAATLIEKLPAEQPWRLHIWPDYGEGRAGENRCKLIRAALVERLQRRRKQLLRALSDAETPLDARTSFVQLVLTSPEDGFFSTVIALRAWELRTILSPFPRGEVPVAVDKSAPSRAFAKLVEAELRLGVSIAGGETCVDLGASPGSWSYVAIQRGARVIAVDRSELRDDLMRHSRLEFHRGDAFKFVPENKVDWLICDVIAAPQRSIDLLLEWLRASRMSRFVVSIKFKGSEEYALIDQLKTTAAPLCREFYLTRLCANKNEVCAFGLSALNQTDS